MAVRAIVFDVGGVLEITPRTGVAERCTEAMVDGARTVGMLALLFEHNAQAIAAIEALVG